MISFDGPFASGRIESDAPEEQVGRCLKKGLKIPAAFDGTVYRIGGAGLVTKGNGGFTLKRRFGLP
jgi:hypothetical protein